ncbi:MAG: hypothetical protein IJ452_06395 [Butyricicoccus sp.]|nr:hypothetical protein [Butyricicoccus sp.]MBQ8585892.1 hypothetical protein [Butyricicoccus sp.]
MPDSFRSIAKNTIHPIAKAAGFHNRGNYYYRIVNDVVQQFCLLHLRIGFTIRFHISSIYNENHRKAEGLEICQLIDGTSNPLGVHPTLLVAHPFDENYQLRPEACAEICRRAFQEYLLPWFDRTQDPVSAYDGARGLVISPLYRYGHLLAADRWTEAEQLLHDLCIPKSTDSKWWLENKPEFVALHRAVSEQDHEFIRQYMEQKKTATYKEFHWK